MSKLVNSIFLVSLLAGISFQTLAGGFTEGNGGDVVVCRSDSGAISSIELLDFYESKLLRGGPIQFPEGQSLDQAFDLLMERMTVYDTYFRDQVLKYKETFLSETLFLRGVEFEDIRDSDHIGIPVGCEIAQIAIQKVPEFPGEKRYHISQDLWDQLDGPNQAGLILHEILFRFVIEHKTREPYNSRAVRYFISLLGSDKVNEFLNYRSYLELIRDEFNITKTNYDGHLANSDFSFYEDGTVKRATLLPAVGKGFVVNQELSLPARGSVVVEYSESGDRESVLVRFGLEPFEFSLKGNRFEKVNRSVNELTFYLGQNGEIVSMRSGQELVGKRRRMNSFLVNVSRQGHAEKVECEEAHFGEEMELVCDSTLYISEDLLAVSFGREGHDIDFTRIVTGYDGEIRELKGAGKKNPDTLYYHVFYRSNGLIDKVDCYGGGVIGPLVPGNPLEEWWCTSPEVVFYESGILKSGGVINKITGTIEGVTAEFYAGPVPVTTCTSNYEGYPNGRPKFARIDRPIQIGNKLYGTGDELSLDQSGRITGVKRHHCQSTRRD